jgi:hypothetical protein
LSRALLVALGVVLAVGAVAVGVLVFGSRDD